MCRWLAYSGTPILMEELLFQPGHSLIDQSLHSTMGATTTNGDGFGVGWYGVGETPAVYHSVEPAWNERNLKQIAAHTVSGLVFAHIRAATGTAVQQTNCHPFRHGRWLWQHNGAIREFHTVKRDLQLAVDPSLFADIEGSTDTETFFYLALTFGLEHDPPAAVAKAVGFIEETGRKHGVEQPIQMTVATTDGKKVWAFRYSSEHDSRTLFYSTLVSTLRDLYPDNPLFHELSDETRLIVSEPLGDLPGAWIEVPESHYGVVQEGQDELHPFVPVARVSVVVGAAARGLVDGSPVRDRVDVLPRRAAARVRGGGGLGDHRDHVLRRLDLLHERRGAPAADVGAGRPRPLPGQGLVGERDPVRRDALLQRDDVPRDAGRARR